MCPKSSCRVVSDPDPPILACQTVFCPTEGGHWPLIGQEWSRDPDTGLSLVAGGGGESKGQGVFEWSEMFSKGCHVSHDASHSVTLRDTQTDNCVTIDPSVEIGFLWIHSKLERGKRDWHSKDAKNEKQESKSGPFPIAHFPIFEFTS